MKRFVYLYGGMAVITVRRAWRKWLRDTGEKLKRLGRELVARGEDTTPRWSIELFHKCYLADAEFHFGLETYRGPMYAAFSDGESLSFRMNWLAKKTDPHGEWDYSHGAGIVRLKVKGYGPPHPLEKGDVYFTFDGGYAVLYLGQPPSERLQFKGPAYTLREYTYF